MFPMVRRWFGLPTNASIFGKNSASVPVAILASQRLALLYLAAPAQDFCFCAGGLGFLDVAGAIVKQ